MVDNTNNGNVNLTMTGGLDKSLERLIQLTNTFENAIKNATASINSLNKTKISLQGLNAPELRKLNRLVSQLNGFEKLNDSLARIDQVNKRSQSAYSQAKQSTISRSVDSTFGRADTSKILEAVQDRIIKSLKSSTTKPQGNKSLSKFLEKEFLNGNGSILKEAFKNISGMLKTGAIRGNLSDWEAMQKKYNSELVPLFKGLERNRKQELMLSNQQLRDSNDSLRGIKKLAEQENKLKDLSNSQLESKKQEVALATAISTQSNKQNQEKSATLQQAKQQTSNLQTHNRLDNAIVQQKDQAIQQKKNSLKTLRAITSLDNQIAQALNTEIQDRRYRLASIEQLNKVRIQSMAAWGRVQDAEIHANVVSTKVASLKEKQLLARRQDILAETIKFKALDWDNKRAIRESLVAQKGSILQQMNLYRSGAAERFQANNPQVNLDQLLRQRIDQAFSQTITDYQRRQRDLAAARNDSLVYSKLNTPEQVRGASLNLSQANQRQLELLEQRRLLKLREDLARGANDQADLAKARKGLQDLGQELTAVNSRIRELNKEAKVQSARSQRLDIAQQFKQRQTGEQRAAAFLGRAAYLSDYATMGIGVGTLMGTYAFLRDFEAALKQTQAIANATEGQMQNLRKAIMEVSDSSRFSAIQLTEATTILAQAGFSVSEIEKTLASVATLATATGSTLSDSVDIATSTLSAFKMSAESMPTVINQITQAMNLSKLDVPKFMLTTQYAANAAADLGISFREMLSATAAVSNTGIRSGSTMGTGMRQLLADLAAPTEKFKAKLTDLGLTLTDIDVRSNGLTGVLKNLKNAGFSTADAFDSFELRATAYYIALSNNLEAYDELYQSMDNTNAALEAQEVQMNSLAAQTDRMTNSFKLFADVVGKDFRDALTSAVRLVANLFSALNTLLDDTVAGSIASFAIMTLTIGMLVKGLVVLGSTLKSTIVVLATMAAVAKGSSLAFFLLGGSSGILASVGALNSLTKSLWVLTAAFLTSPLGWFTVGLAGVAAAFGYVNSKAEEVNETLDAAKTKWNNSKEAVTQTESALAEINERIKSVDSRILVLSKDSSELANAFTEVREKARQLGVHLDTELKGNVQNLQLAWSELREEMEKTLQLQLQTEKSSLQGLRSAYEAKAQQESENTVLQDAISKYTGLGGIWNPINPKNTDTRLMGVTESFTAGLGGSAKTKLSGNISVLDNMARVLGVSGTERKNLELFSSLLARSQSNPLELRGMTPEQKQQRRSEISQALSGSASVSQKWQTALGDERNKYPVGSSKQKELDKEITIIGQIFGEFNAVLQKQLTYLDIDLQEKQADQNIRNSNARVVVGQQSKKLTFTDAEIQGQLSPTNLDRDSRRRLNAVLKYNDLITKYAQDYNVDPNLIKAIMMQESSGKVNARSPVGAGGLMQLMPPTARELGVKDVNNPVENIRGGVQYISEKLNEFNGDINLALAAYNAGAGAVKKAGGIPNFPETKNYVKKVGSYYQNLSNSKVPLGSEVLQSIPLTQDQGRAFAETGLKMEYFKELINKENNKLNNGNLTEIEKAESEAMVKAYQEKLNELGQSYSATAKSLSDLTKDTQKRLIFELNSAAVDLDIEKTGIEQSISKLERSLTDGGESFSEDKYKELTSLYKDLENTSLKLLENDFQQKQLSAGIAKGNLLTLDAAQNEVEVKKHSLEIQKLVFEFEEKRLDLIKKINDAQVKGIKNAHETRIKAIDNEAAKEDIKYTNRKHARALAYTNSARQLDYLPNQINSDIDAMNSPLQGYKYSSIQKELYKQRFDEINYNHDRIKKSLELKKDADDILDRQKQISAEIANQVKKQDSANQAIKELNPLVRNNSKEYEEYTKQIEDSNTQMNALTNESKDLDGQLKSIRNTIENINRDIPEQMPVLEQLYKAYNLENRNLNSQGAGVDKIKENIDSLKDGFISLGEAIANESDNVDDFFKHLLGGTRKGKEAWKDMLREWVAGLLKSQVLKLLGQIYESALGGLQGYMQPNASGGLTGTQRIVGFLGQIGGAILGGSLGGVNSTNTIGVDAAAAGGDLNFYDSMSNRNTSFYTASTGGRIGSQPVKRMSDGGQVQGGVPNRDSVHVLAQPDEHMIKANTSRYLGKDFLDSLNRSPASTMKAITAKPNVSVDNYQETSVYVVTPDQVPANINPNQIIAIVSDNLERGGSLNKKIKTVVNRG